MVRKAPPSGSSYSSNSKTIAQEPSRDTRRLQGSLKKGRQLRPGERSTILVNKERTGVRPAETKAACQGNYRTERKEPQPREDKLTPKLQMEVGCPGTQELQPQSHPKVEEPRVTSTTHNPATSLQDSQ